MSDETLDSREKLEADMERLIEDAMSYGWKQQPRISADAIELLDRQAAITEREWLEGKTHIFGMTFKEVRDLQAKVDSLTAERDELKAKLESIKNAEYYDLLTAERDGLNVKLDEIAQLRKVVRQQADSFAALEAENKALDESERDGGRIERVRIGHTWYRIEE